MRLGALLLRCGRTHEAIDVLNTAVRLKKDDPAYHCLLADAYLREGMETEAVIHYRRAGVLDDYDAVNLSMIRRMVDEEYSRTPR
jgi:Flp pilus assembly protein TadD